MLNGQLKADAGAVTLLGRSLVGLPPREIWRMGVGRTFQITATLNSMTVRENIPMALLSFHRRLMAFWNTAADYYRDAAMTLLDRVGMADTRERAGGELADEAPHGVKLTFQQEKRPGGHGW